MSTTAVTPDSAPVSEHGHLISTDPGWRKTGLMPESKPEVSPSPEPNSVNSTVSETATSESAAASEAAQPQEHQPRRSTADTRLPKLLDKIKTLEAQLEEARRPKETKTAESSPARTVEAPKELKPPVKPNPADAKYSGTKGWELLETDRDKYVEEMIDYKASQKVTEAEQRYAQRAEVEKLNAQVAEIKKQYPEWESVTQPVVDALVDPVTRQSKINPGIAARINNSAVMPQLLYVIGSDAAERDAFFKECATNPQAAYDRVVVLEALIREETSGTAERAPVRQVPKPTPPPLPEVSGKGTASTDEVQQAAEASAQSGKPRDFKKYAEAKNRADLARRKGK